MTLGFRRDMEPLFFPDTIDEFLFEYLEPGLKQLHDLRDGAIRLGAKKNFALRPFRIESALQQKKAVAAPATNRPEERKVVGDRETRRR
jgi:hypothetical protein